VEALGHRYFMAKGTSFRKSLTGSVKKSKSKTPKKHHDSLRRTQLRKSISDENK
jgi:hypothetical protein